MAASSIRFVGGRYGVPNGTLSALLRAGIDKSSWPNTNLSSVCQPQIIYSCHVAFPPDRGSTQPGAVSVSSDGIIDGCYPNLSIYQAKSLAETLNRDLTDLGPDIALSPGLIDVHCHISELGRDWEGYSTATRAAAAGGITTLMGMPLNSIPATTSTDALVREVAAASNDGTTLMADVGLWGGAVPANVTDSAALSGLLDGGVFGLKAFLAPLPPGAGYDAVDPVQLAAAARICGDRKKPLLVHSELMTEDQVAVAVQKAYSGTKNGHTAHLASRPAQWERDAVRTVCELADICHMHVVHLSDSGCLDLIAEAKDRIAKGRGRVGGGRGALTVETCPHYLLFHSEAVPESDTRYKCFPPIRGQENQLDLWGRGMTTSADGPPLIDMVASDHSPCPPDLRCADDANMRDAWGGLSGLQYQLPATSTAFQRARAGADGGDGDLLVGCVAEWWSRAPSQLVPGLSSIKGEIAVGRQADLCAWDPTFVGRPSDRVAEHHRWPGGGVYADMELRGRVAGTWLRGVRVYDGERDAFVADDDGAGSLMLSCR